MNERHYILATAGHIDHGKTAVVKALTGSETDRLPEEKARGITIELGFAELTLPHPTTPEATIRLGVVDVPGHEDFVRNMVGGVPYVDLALVVVAADDGWMPQTEEHTQILQYLRARRAIIALNKVDLAEDPDFVLEMIREELVDSPLAEVPIVPISAKTGEGIDKLRALIAEVATELAPPIDIGKPRLGIDRAFSLPGRGAVVTGTLFGGRLQREQSVVVHPNRGEARVRSVQQHGRDATEGVPGSRVALNLSQIGLSDRRSGGNAGLRRGDVVTLPESGVLSDCFDVAIERSPRLRDSQYARAVALRHGVQLRVHLHATSAEARLLLDSRRERVEPGEQCIARLKLTHPMWVLAGDRFILRDSAQSTTLGGGWILDPRPTKAPLKTPEVQEFLQARVSSELDPTAWIWPRIQREKTVGWKTLFEELPLSFREFECAIRSLENDQRAQRIGPDHIADATLVYDVLGAMESLVDAGHRKRPEAPGIEAPQLRKTAIEAGAPHSAIEVFLDAFRQRGFETERQYWRRTGFQPRLPEPVEREADFIRDALRDHPFDPKNRERLHESPDRQKAVRFLVEAGEITRLGDDVFLLTATVNMLRVRVKTFLKLHGKATSPQLRDEIGASRKFLIPLLERFDEEGLTQRDGDWRILKP